MTLLTPFDFIRTRVPFHEGIYSRTFLSNTSKHFLYRFFSWLSFRLSCLIVKLTFVFTATPDQVAEGDRLFASHAPWMERTHPREGDLALLHYNVVKGPELSNPLDPYSRPTGNTCFVLDEVYETPAGLDDHWKQGAGNWEPAP